MGSSQGKEGSVGRDTWGVSVPQMYTHTSFSRASPWSLSAVSVLQPGTPDQVPGGDAGRAGIPGGKCPPTHFPLSPWCHLPAGSLAEPPGPVSHRLDSNRPLDN